MSLAQYTLRLSGEAVDCGSEAVKSEIEAVDPGSEAVSFRNEAVNPASRDDAGELVTEALSIPIRLVVNG